MKVWHPWQLKKSKSWEPAKQHCQFSTFGPIFELNGLDWQCCLAGSSITAPRILIFSIAMGTEYLFYVISIATFAPTFHGYIISVLASVLFIYTPFHTSTLEITGNSYLRYCLLYVLRVVTFAVEEINDFDFFSNY